jgi:hypothetical protein
MNYFLLFSYAEELSPPGRARGGTEGGRRRHHQVLVILIVLEPDPRDSVIKSPGSGAAFSWIRGSGSAFRMPVPAI